MIMLYQTMAKFKSKKGGSVYFVKQHQKTGKLSCSCKAWIHKMRCKHIDYVKKHPFIELTDIPTYQEACHMAWGRDKGAKEKWLSEHLKEIVL